MAKQRFKDTQHAEQYLRDNRAKVGNKIVNITKPGIKLLGACDYLASNGYRIVVNHPNQSLSLIYGAH